MSFESQFGASPEAKFFSPGRVNLIGEHIDYCGGLVMPMAISRGTEAHIGLNGTNKICVFSERFNEYCEIPLSGASKTDHWTDFIVGVLALLEGCEPRGMNMYVTDDLSAGGLSSSASFSLLLAHACHWSAGQTIRDDKARLALATMCQKVEHDYIGVSCGIMDQASVALGGVMVLDCAQLQFDKIDGGFGDYSIVVMDTCHARTLAGSKYNERVAEISQIQSMLASHYSLANLCELPESELDRAMSLFSEDVLQRRLRHIVTEQSRVIKAKTSLLAGDLPAFGELMVGSHDSLRRDYEVTGDALDTIVEISNEQSGTLGSRMTGAGFGGCALSLVKTSELDDHNTVVSERYHKATGVKPKLFEVQPSGPSGQVSP